MTQINAFVDFNILCIGIEISSRGIRLMNVYPQTILYQMVTVEIYIVIFKYYSVIINYS